MVGIFQLFGISFLFWIFIGLLRFVFETIHALRSAEHATGIINLLLAAIAGISVSVSLFLIYFFSFGPVDLFLDAAAFPTFALAMLTVWLACVALGSYLATRIYIARPYLVAIAVGVGAVLTGIALLLAAEVNLALTQEAIRWQLIWIGVTLGAAFLGGHIANALNALERERGARHDALATAARITKDEVAVLIAAHNEEISIGTTIESLLAFLPPQQIYVASDGSSDRTAKIVRSLKCTVDDIKPNRGKAGALTYAIEKNNLLTRYKAVFLLDADMKVAPDFFRHALPHFDEPRTAAVTGYFETLWPKRYIPEWRMLVPAYRVRLWRVLQFLVRYGQTWKYLNASPIIPGGASIYRSEVLKQIRIDVPGLIIEDFNMTFEVHHKKLGVTIFEPRCRVVDQEPYSIRDFVKQITRWYVGYFQTIKRHGFWFSPFCFFTYFFTLEMVMSALLFLIIPLFLLELLLSGREILAFDGVLGGYHVTLLGVILSLFVFDYLITVVVAMIEKKPSLLVYGLLFFPVRYLEAAVFLYSIPVAFFSKSDGKWKSPKRIAFEA